MTSDHNGATAYTLLNFQFETVEQYHYHLYEIQAYFTVKSAWETTLFIVVYPKFFTF